MVTMKILILGAGAVGGYFGGRLVQYQQQQQQQQQHQQQQQQQTDTGAEFHVTFLVRPRRAEQIRNDGLRLQHPDGSILSIDNVATIISEEDSSKERSSHDVFDVIVLACKSYGLTGALEAIAPFVHPQVAILPLLNGMAHLQTIQRRFSSVVVWGGTCGIVATLDSNTGVIHRMTPNHFVRAGLIKSDDADATTVNLTTFIQHLKDAGLEAGADDDIVQTMYDKWTFLASAAAATCLMTASIGEILSTDYGQELLLGLYYECNAVATADGALPADLSGRQALYKHALSDKNSIVKTSMCRDMESGSPTEADHVIGDMIQRAVKHDIATPLLKTAYTRLQIHEAQVVVTSNNSS
jgi:2-dehydropantoate 2-reductase